MTVTVGSQLAGYRLEEEVGRGGMGVVYRARELALDRPVALKLIAPELARDPSFRERFLSESRLAASIDHPSILPVYAAGEAEGELYLATRYVEGSDLGKLLAEEGPLTPARALDLVGQVAYALDAAHRRGLVHRDVKPGNVLLDGDEHCYLADFGLTSTLGEGGATQAGPLAGSLEYLAPEQIRGGKLDGRTDAYALACVLYECLSGAPPFRRPSEAQTLWAHLQEAPAPLAHYPELDSVFARALAKEPSERYESCGAFVEDARSALGLGPSPVEVQRRRVRIARMLVAAGLALLLMAAAAGVMLALVQRGSNELSQIAPNSLGAIDPATNRLVAQIPIAGRPTRVDGGPRVDGGRGVLWVADDESGTLSAVDPRTRTVTRLAPTGGFPSDLAVDDDAVWVADARRGLLVKIDASYGTVADRIRVAPPTSFYDASRESVDPTAVAAGIGAVWLTLPGGELVRVDTSTGSVRHIDLGVRLNDVAVGAGGVWTISGPSSVLYRVDPATGAVALRIPIPPGRGLESPFPIAVRVNEGFVWVLNANAASVTKIDPTQRAVSTTIPIGIEHNPVRLAVGAGAAWVANGDGTLARIDARTNKVELIRVGHRLRDVAVSFETVWVTAGSGLGIAPSEAPAVGSGHARPLPTSWCSPVYYQGSSEPEYLIASDMPLLGGGFATTQMSQAIQFVLRQRGFRAGTFTVGYQSCDDSASGAPLYSLPRCGRNAQTYARNRSVIGIIGTFNSPCTQIELPVLNRAIDGPLALVSHANTYVGLTRQGFATEPDEPRRYYPTGERSYVRIVAADDVQATADALLARRLGVRRVFALRAGDYSYALGLARAFSRAARRLGLAVVGFETWPRASSRVGSLAARVRASRADAVFLSGTWREGGDGLIRDLRTMVGRNLQIIAPDGFTPVPDVIAAVGPEAEGMTVSVAGLPNDRLPEAGREFVRSFGEAVGEPPGPYTVYAAQAAEVLLDAIARSDGSRASVTQELLRTKVSDGILGSFSIDRNGDTTARVVTIYQVVRGAPRVFAVITPPPSLMR